MSVDSIRFSTPQFPQVSSNRPQHGFQKTEIRENPVQTEPEAVASTLSKYLSTEEKDLLGVLFPPSGRDFGIGQYRKVQAPPQAGRVLGQTIDITT
jgi:hypothetical protein